MSAHEGVSCDACHKSNFCYKRFKCLICFDYDLCSTCYEQDNISSQHTTEHPMQCIITRQDFDLYYRGETHTLEFPQSLTCPLCGEMGLAFPYLQDSSSGNNHHNSQNLDLFQHLQMKHANNQQTHDVICPICASMINGDSNFVTGDIISHIANDHQHSQVNTPSSAGGAPTGFLRQAVPSRDYDFVFGARGGFRRGSSRIFRGRAGIGRGGNSVNPHLLADTLSGSSSSTNGNDPISDFLSQLSNARRLTTSNNTGTSTNPSLSSVLNTINLQSITRQQYERERERLRAATRSQQSTLSRVLSADTDIFDSLFESNLNDQTWTHINAPSQTTPDQSSQPPPPSSSTSSNTDPSLLRRLCNESSTSSNQPNEKSSKAKSDFVQNLLLSSFIDSINNQPTE
ncbi:unnamed protein product [Adineta ricciae]|uniref:RING-type E3 ubiquitin transferase n=1 Tax=Adineta ricciae TaxID=249248 RepID=A0A813WP12_ADIRI|nr:unnamed protein product [Adineta ricciae]CAF0960183.1 unnamed protein product [Adineta ricciae]